MMDELLKSLPVVIPMIVSGIMALGGVYLAGRLSRRTQYGTWLVQKRAEHYESFWLSYKEAYDTIGNYRNSDDFKRDNLSVRQEKIKPTYGPFLKELNITRLYASKSVKGRIEKLENEFSRWCSMMGSYKGSATISIAEAFKSGTEEATALIRLFNLERELQEAFERDLKKM
jgi:hypothetical protein